METKRIVLVGGGGHASDVLGALEVLGVEVAGIVADVEIDMSRFEARGLRQIGSIDDLRHLDANHFIAAVGYPGGRRAVAQRAVAAGLKPYTVIHPSAILPKHLTICDGALVLAGACISPLARLGAQSYVSVCAVVGHDCEVGDYVSIMPGACVSGDTKLGTGAIIGANSTVLEKLSVGAGATVGAGAVVTKDIPDGETWVGSPARRLK